MRTPGRHGGVERFSLGFVERHVHALACTSERIHDHIAIWLPRAQHFVPPIPGKERNQAIHVFALEHVAVHFTGHVGQMKLGQGAVAIEGDVFGFEVDHVHGPVVKIN